MHSSVYWGFGEIAMNAVILSVIFIAPAVICFAIFILLQIVVLIHFIGIKIALKNNPKASKEIVLWSFMEVTPQQWNRFMKGLAITIFSLTLFSAKKYSEWFGHTLGFDTALRMSSAKNKLLSFKKVFRVYMIFFWLFIWFFLASMIVSLLILKPVPA